MPMAIFFGNDIFETFLILRVSFVVIRIAERACDSVFDAGIGMAYGMFYPTIWCGVRYCCHCSMYGAVKLLPVRLFDRTRAFAPIA
jgi:hypothetical protein